MSNKSQSLFNTSKAKLFAFILFFVISVILFYLCKHLFFYDEDIFVVNPHGNFMSDFSRAPVVKLTYLADNYFFATNATGYHVTNIFLHLCNTILAAYTFRLLLRFTVLDELKAKNASYIFFFAFLLSPVHSEPLCYLLGRAGLLVTFFCILSLLFFLKANFKSRELLLVSLIFFLLALLSYEISWTFPLIILLVANYLKQSQPLSGKKFFKYVAPFFIVFCVWILAKLVLVNQKTTPYGNEIFFPPDSPRLIKNVVVLFFRNMVPPFENTVVFVVVSIVTSVLFLYICINIAKKNRALLFFALLLIVSCFLAYLPALIFGINSHNSESERYVYFSSVFAIMFLAIAISLLHNPLIKQFAVLAGCCIYALFLFAAINNYVGAGKFSQNYLGHLTKEQGNTRCVYLLNQPSQYKGALLFRAYSDEPGSAQKKFTTIRDYMYQLYRKNNSEYITVSKQKIFTRDTIKDVVQISADSLSTIFRGFYLNKAKNNLINSYTGDSTYFENGSSVIAGLKPPLLYIFK